MHKKRFLAGLLASAIILSNVLPILAISDAEYQEFKKYNEAWHRTNNASNWPYSKPYYLPEPHMTTDNQYRVNLKKYKKEYDLIDGYLVPKGKSLPTNVNREPSAPTTDNADTSKPETPPTPTKPTQPEKKPDDKKKQKTKPKVKPVDTSIKTKPENVGNTDESGNQINSAQNEITYMSEALGSYVPENGKTSNGFLTSTVNLFGSESANTVDKAQDWQYMLLKGAVIYTMGELKLEDVQGSTIYRQLEKAYDIFHLHGAQTKNISVEGIKSDDQTTVRAFNVLKDNFPKAINAGWSSSTKPYEVYPVANKKSYILMALYKAVNVKYYTPQIVIATPLRNSKDAVLPILYTPYFKDVQANLQRDLVLFNNGLGRLILFADYNNIEAYVNRAINDNLVKEYDIDEAYIQENKVREQLFHTTNILDNKIFIDINPKNIMGNQPGQNTSVGEDKRKAFTRFYNITRDGITRNRELRILKNDDQGYTMVDFLTLASKIMYLSGEPELTKEELNDIDIDLGTMVSDSLTEDQSHAIKYLVGKGVINTSTDLTRLSERVTDAFVYETLMRIADPNSRLTYKIPESDLRRFYKDKGMRVQDVEVGGSTIPLTKYSVIPDSISYTSYAIQKKLVTDRYGDINMHDLAIVDISTAGINEEFKESLKRLQASDSNTAQFPELKTEKIKRLGDIGKTFRDRYSNEYLTFTIPDKANSNATRVAIFPMSRKDLPNNIIEFNLTETGFDKNVTPLQDADINDIINTSPFWFIPKVKRNSNKVYDGGEIITKFEQDAGAIYNNSNEVRQEYSVPVTDDLKNYEIRYKDNLGKVKVMNVAEAIKQLDPPRAPKQTFGEATIEKLKVDGQLRLKIECKVAGVNHNGGLKCFNAIKQDTIKLEPDGSLTNQNGKKWLSLGAIEKMGITIDYKPGSDIMTLTNAIGHQVFIDNKAKRVIAGSTIVSFDDYKGYNIIEDYKGFVHVAAEAVTPLTYSIEMTNEVKNLLKLGSTLLVSGGKVGETTGVLMYYTDHNIYTRPRIKADIKKGKLYVDMMTLTSTVTPVVVYRKTSKPDDIKISVIVNKCSTDFKKTDEYKSKNFRAAMGTDYASKATNLIDVDPKSVRLSYDKDANALWFEVKNKKDYIGGGKAIPIYHDNEITELMKDGTFYFIIDNRSCAMTKSQESKPAADGQQKAEQQTAPEKRFKDIPLITHYTYNFNYMLSKDKKDCQVYIKNRDKMQECKLQEFYNPLTLVKGKEEKPKFEAIQLYPTSILKFILLENQPTEKRTIKDVEKGSIIMIGGVAYIVDIDSPDPKGKILLKYYAAESKNAMTGNNYAYMANKKLPNDMYEYFVNNLKTYVTLTGLDKHIQFTKGDKSKPVLLESADIRRLASNYIGPDINKPVYVLREEILEINSSNLVEGEEPLSVTAKKLLDKLLGRGNSDIAILGTIEYAVDSIMSFLLVVVMDIIPRIMMFSLLGLGALSMMSNSKAMRRIMAKFDLAYILSFTMTTFDKLEYSTGWLYSIVGSVLIIMIHRNALFMLVDKIMNLS